MEDYSALLQRLKRSVKELDLATNLVLVEDGYERAKEDVLAILRSTCPGCGRRTDSEVCWCGEHEKNHTSDHSFIPMGCQCGRISQ